MDLDNNGIDDITGLPIPKKSSGLDSFLASAGISAEEIRAAMAASKSGTTEKKPLKSGTYVSTQISSRIPDALALKDKIDTVFQKYYGRDASQTELQTWVPLVQSQYKSKTGKSKTTVRSTYKNGQLINTEYLTAEGQDPALWLEGKVKENIATGKLQLNTQNVPEGPAGRYFEAFKNFAGNNGIRLSDQAANTYASQIVAGQLDENTVFNTIRESAANAFPSLADKIKAGIDLKTLADPYIQSMSNILELPSTSLDVFDPNIRQALAYTLPDGKVGTKSIYDFEKDLRKDARWQYTDNARRSVSSGALKVLQDFGLQG
jgi:hypothetical protein